MNRTLKIYNKLAKLLRGPIGLEKNPADFNMSWDKRVPGSLYATFGAAKRMGYNMYRQTLKTGINRQTRYRDYEWMDCDPLLSSALDIYADNCTTRNELDQILEIESDNDSLKKELESLFYKILDINFYLWGYTRNLCKYGDLFLAIESQPRLGVTALFPLPTIEVEREEGYDGNPNSVRFRWLIQGTSQLEPYQVAHIRLLGDDAFLPYGRSILEPARKHWKSLNLMEDSMLVYRITRSPERRVFYIDVGNLQSKEIDGYIQNIRDELKRSPAVDTSNGRKEYRFNPLDMSEDFFIPVRGDKSSRVESLPGGQNTGDIDDVRYIESKMFIALKVPKKYLAKEDDGDGLSRANLAQQDIQFSRTVERIQRVVISELNKIAMIHLYLKGYDEKELENFTLKLTNPSSYREIQKMELLTQKIEVAEKAVESKFIGREWIYENIFGMSHKEIDDQQKQIIADHKFLASLESINDTSDDNKNSDDDKNDSDNKKTDIKSIEKAMELPEKLPVDETISKYLTEAIRIDQRVNALILKGKGYSFNENKT